MPWRRHQPPAATTAQNGRENYRNVPPDRWMWGRGGEIGRRRTYSARVSHDHFKGRERLAPASHPPAFWPGAGAWRAQGTWASRAWPWRVWGAAWARRAGPGGKETTKEFDVAQPAHSSHTQPHVPELPRSDTHGYIIVRATWRSQLSPTQSHTRARAHECHKQPRTHTDTHTHTATHGLARTHSHTPSA